MNGMIYGRVVGGVFGLMGLVILGLTFNVFGEEDFTHFDSMSLGFVFSFIGLAFIIKPGPADIRFDTADDYDDRQQKGRAWIAAVRQRPRLLLFYGGALALGFSAFICTDTYLQGESLTGWSVFLKIGFMLAVVAFAGWRISRPKTA